MENRVYFAPCADYGEEAVRAAFDRLLPEGTLDFVASGMRVGIKVNLVSAMKPESAGVTHPALVRELCRRLVERGAEVIVGDSPGGLTMPRCFRTSTVCRVWGRSRRSVLP